MTKEVSDTAKGGSGVWAALGSVVVLAYSTRVLYRAVVIVHPSRGSTRPRPRRPRRDRSGIFGLGLAGQLALAVAVGAVRAQTAAGESSSSPSTP